MNTRTLGLCLLFAGVPSIVSPQEASAQTPDLDSDDRQKEARQRRAQQVKEITKGAYAKANVGAAMYLGNFAGFVSPGSSLGLSLGVDFIDQEKISMAIEGAFFQGVHNGCDFQAQADGLCPGRPGELGPLVQGDLRTYLAAGILEWSTYPHRRWGLGLRVGGGILSSPLLMDATYYQDEVVGGAWQGYAVPNYHGTPHPTVLGGPTLEYYTKLSHLSLGIDIDAFYAIDFDLGLSTTGTLKYTF